MIDKELIDRLLLLRNDIGTSYPGLERNYGSVVWQAAERLEALTKEQVPERPDYGLRLNALENGFEKHGRQLEALEHEAIRISPSGSTRWYKFGSQQELINWLRSLPF